MPYPCDDCDSFPTSPIYPCDITDIINTDSVDESVINTPLGELETRTDYLKCLVESLDFTTAHFISDITLDASVDVGHVVYYDTSQSPAKYNKSFVDVVGRNVYEHEDDGTRTLDSSVQDSSYAIGIVVRKDPEITVCVGGTFKSRQFEEGLLTALTGVVTPEDDTVIGQFYLSNKSTSSGTVQKAKPPLGVPVCFITRDETGEAGDYLITVNPQLHDLLLAHRHYSFALQAKPAVALPIGYNPAGAETTLSPTYDVGQRVDIHLYEWDNVCAQTASSTVDKVIGTAVYAGDHATYGALVVGFEPTAYYIEFLKEEEGCISSSGPDDTFECYLKLWDRGGYLTVENGSADIGTIHAGFMETAEAAGDSPVYRNTNGEYVINETLLLSEVDDGTVAWDALVSSGWCPCSQAGVTCPEGATYYYDWSNDNVLSLVWPPYPVASSVMFINGALANTSKLTINDSGIFWFDSEDPPFSFRFPDVPAPRKNTTDWDDTDGLGFGDMLPHENLLFYTISASNTDEMVVRSLTPATGSVITLKDGNGADKTTGDLTINAEFALSDDSPAAGAYVVKDIEGFAVKKGYVVERIKSGPLITVESTLVGGQGEVTITAADFGGVRESEPDLFFADDIVVERHKDIFYKVFPSGRQSSLTGKVFVPTFLPIEHSETYSIKIFGQFMTPSSGTGLTLPSLNIEYKVVDNVGSVYEGSTGSIDTEVLLTNTLVLGGSYDRYNYKVLEITGVAEGVTVTPGDTFMFKIIRDGVADSSSYKVGLVDIRYQISKSGC